MEPIKFSPSAQELFDIVGLVPIAGTVTGIIQVVYSLGLLIINKVRESLTENSNEKFLAQRSICTTNIVKGVFALPPFLGTALLLWDLHEREARV